MRGLQNKVAMVRIRDKRKYFAGKRNTWQTHLST